MTGWFVQSSLVAAAILVAVRAIRGRSAVLREALLLVALVKFAIPPPVLPFGSVFDALLPEPADLVSVGVVQAGTPSGDGFAAQPAVWLVALYLAGVVAVFAAAIGGQMRLLRALRSAAPADAALQARVVFLARAIGCRGTITLQKTDSIAAPIAVGVLRRRIVVPARLLASLTAAEIDAILLHEIAHHRRGHIAAGWARATVCAVWWWNPLAWMVGTALRHTQEEVCDDLVVERAGMPPERYCDVLVRAASVAGTPAGAAAFAQALHPLGRRVKRLLDGAPARTRARTVWALALVVACIALPGAASRPAPETRETAAMAQRSSNSTEPQRIGAAAVPGAASRSRRTASAVPPARTVRSSLEAAVPAPEAPAVQKIPSLPMSSLFLTGLRETLVQIPITVGETRREAAESVRDVVDQALRDVAAPPATATRVGGDAERRIEVLVEERKAVRTFSRSVRETNRSFFHSLNPMNWFKSGSSSPSPSPSPPPSPSPSPSPSKSRN
jgi:bla regulator protein BlaR1